MSRLLLVDDEPHVLNALQRVMRRRLPPGVRIESFDNPVRALARARELAFDVIISDFRMPQMDGIAFLRQVRDAQPHAVRMILSPSTEVDTVMKAINDVEVFRYLAKPWQDDELLAHVQQALQRAESGRHERGLADDMRVQRGDLSMQAAELKRLEEQEPGITHVEWGPNGEVLMPDLENPPPGRHSHEH